MVGDFLTHIEYTAAIFYGIPLWNSIQQLLNLYEGFWEEAWEGRQHTYKWEQVYGRWFDDQFQVKRGFKSRFEEAITDLFDKINTKLESQKIPATLALYDIPKYCRRVPQPFLCVDPSYHEVSATGEGWGRHLSFRADPIDTSAWDQQLEAICKREELSWAIPPTFHLIMQVPLTKEPYTELFYAIRLPGGYTATAKYFRPTLADQSLRSTDGLATFSFPMADPNPWDFILREVCEKYAFNWVAPQFHLLLSYTA